MNNILIVDIQMGVKMVVNIELFILNIFLHEKMYYNT